MEHALMGAAQMPQSTLIEYPFVLRDGLLVRLFLPADLSVTDRNRLSKFLDAICAEHTHHFEWMGDVGTCGCGARMAPKDYYDKAAV